jgi:hypothetical protein
MAVPIKAKAPARAFLPAQAVMVAFGRWRVDGRDAKRQYRRFFTGPQAEVASKKHAAELNRAHAASKGKPVPAKVPAGRAHLPAVAVSVGPGRYRVDGRDAKRQYRRFFTGPQAEAQAKKHAADLNAAHKASPPGRTHLPAVVVSVAPGRFRVDGRDAKRMYRRFFTGPNAERDAKAHAAQLNSAPRPTQGVTQGSGKPGAKLGGGLGAVLAAHNALVAKQAATAKAKTEAAQKKAVGQFATLHQQAAITALDELTPGSNRAAVIFAIRQCELASIPQARVEGALKGRGFDQNKLAMFVRQLQAETLKA